MKVQLKIHLMFLNSLMVKKYISMILLTNSLLVDSVRIIKQSSMASTARFYH